MLAACAPTPEPTPTPTALFSSDEEAYAAAEETYAAYAAASNAVTLTDPRTFESVYAWLDDAALAAAKKSYSTMHADDLALSGTTTYDTVDGVEFSNDVVLLELCLDLTDIELTNSSGDSVLSEDREVRQRTEVEFHESATETGLIIVRSTVLPEPSC